MADQYTWIMGGGHFKFSIPFRRPLRIRIRRHKTRFRLRRRSLRARRRPRRLGRRTRRGGGWSSAQDRGSTSQPYLFCGQRSEHNARHRGGPLSCTRDRVRAWPCRTLTVPFARRGGAKSTHAVCSCRAWFVQNRYAAVCLQTQVSQAWYRRYRFWGPASRGYFCKAWRPGRGRPRRRRSSMRRRRGGQPRPCPSR